MPTRPLWAEVSRQRLLANYKKLLGMAGSQAELMPVVKANAYGHDVLACAPLLAGAGATWLGVTSTEEGVAVRAVCPEPGILLMSGIFRGEADTVIDLGLTACSWEPGGLMCWRKPRFAGVWRPGRLRFTWRSIPGCRARGCGWRAPAVLHRFQDGSCLRLEGVMTHFSTPETMSSVRPNPQLAGLDSALQVDR